MLAGLDPTVLAASFAADGGFLQLPAFLPGPLSRMLAQAAQAAGPEVHRNFLPGHKQGGSVSRHVLDRLAPGIAALYRSPQLLAWLSLLTGETLQLSPEDDPHAYALYFYTRPGDHIGWHYDTSYYEGRRFTLLLGVVDDTDCRLEYQLHTRDAQRTPRPGVARLAPGGLVFFDGDRVRHRVTPFGSGTRRVTLTFEYLTATHMRPWRRFVSNMKDALAYFGFRQVFTRAPTPRGT